MAFPSGWGMFFPGEARCWRQHRGGVSPRVPGHVRCGVPGMINHTPRGREGAMEVEPWQQGGAGASPGFIFRLEGSRAGHSREAPGGLSSLPHLCAAFSPSLPAFPGLPSSPCSSPASVCLSPRQGAQREAERGSAGQREPERLVQRGIELRAAAATAGTVPIPRPLRGRVCPGRRGAVPGAAAAEAPAGAGLGAGLIGTGRQQAARGRCWPAQSPQRRHRGRGQVQRLRFLPRCCRRPRHGHASCPRRGQKQPRGTKKRPRGWQSAERCPDGA